MEDAFQGRGAGGIKVRPLHAHAPRFAGGVVAFGERFAADFDEEVFQLSLAEQSGDLVDAEALGDGAQVELQSGDVLGEPAVGGDREMPEADGLPRGLDLLRGGAARNRAVGAEAP